MVTGDSLQTAKAIALECGILTDADISEPTLIEGRVFRAKCISEREQIAEKIIVRQQLTFFYIFKQHELFSSDFCQIS